jgi:thiol:disulfide interchange protein DsbD
MTCATGWSGSPAPRAGRAGLALLALVGLLLAASGGWADEEFLPVEQAFPVVARADGPGAVRVRWEVASGYYLYRDKLRFASQTPGILAGKPELPNAETKRDAFFGEVPIYRGPLEILLPIERLAGSGNGLDLEVRFQGCADAGFCYPPHRRTLNLALPPLAAAAPTPAAPEPATSVPTASPAVPAPRVLDALGAQSLGLGDDDIPTAEQAFQLEAQVADTSQLKLRWDIAPGTYLYRSKLSLSRWRAPRV